MSRGNRGWRLLAPVAGAVLAIACGSDPSVPEGSARFVIDVSGEEFRVDVSSPDEIAAFEARMASGQRGVISGPLRPGSGGFNQPWTWHLDPDSVVVAELAIEVCDGRPSMIEDDLDYWLDALGRYCPWGAKVVRREEQNP